MVMEKMEGKIFVCSLLLEQKHPPRGVPSERCSKNMQQIYMRTPTPKCEFSYKFAAYVQNTFL